MNHERGISLYKGGNYLEAAVILNQLAANGSADAYNHFASMYFLVTGLPDVGKEEFRIVENLAEGGDSEAQQILASMYFYGKGVQKNKNEELKWLEKSLSQGNTVAAKISMSKSCIGEGIPMNPHIRYLCWFPAIGGYEMKAGIPAIK